MSKIESCTAFQQFRWGEIVESLSQGHSRRVRHQYGVAGGNLSRCEGKVDHLSAKLTLSCALLSVHLGLESYHMTTTTCTYHYSVKVLKRRYRLYSTGTSAMMYDLPPAGKFVSRQSVTYAVPHLLHLWRIGAL
eukprot:1402171-Amphidinium_carterae.1